MVFSSLTFLLLFLPPVLALYYLVPRSWRNGVLFLVSLVFYAWGEPVYVLLMLFSTVLDYCCGLLAGRHRGRALSRLGLILSLCGNLGLLGFFKYADFLLGSFNALTGSAIPLPGLPLPIGISFYTFQTMSYTIDVYRGEVEPQRSFLRFGAYVSLFPQLIAGPIVRYRDVAAQLEERSLTPEGFGAGALRFVTGLAKKLLLANNMGLLWDTLSQIPGGELSALGAWLGILAFAFQIYFDFSGYSDMAIGLGKMLGFDFPENFRYPYVSRSVTEFWRRWHMTLGSWFRDYVYIPLGGNRRGKLRWLRNLAVVWLLTGLWHGASWNFLLWGAFYGLLLGLEKLLSGKAPAGVPVLGRVYTALAVLLGWVLFAFEDLGAGWAYAGALFGGGAGAWDGEALYQLRSFLPLLTLCAVGSTPLPRQLWERCLSHWPEGLALGARAAGMCLLFALCIALLISGSYNPFLYFRF